MEMQTELWLSVVGTLYKRVKLEEFVKEKGVYPKQIWQHIEPLSQHFFQVVTGKSQFRTLPNPASEAVCINRLLNTPLDSLASNVGQKLTKLICNMFYLGMMTQLYIFKGDARPKCTMVDLEKISAKWEFVSTNAGIALDKHGGQNSEFFKKIHLAYFDSAVKPFLENELKMGGFMGAFRMGKMQNFFGNLYYAGMALALRCEVEAQEL